MVKGEVADWPILKGLGGQVGDWVDQAVSARQVASLIIESFPIEGQPGARANPRVVADCARTLGLDEPEVHVRNSPFTQAYTSRAFGRDHLVLTSGLLNLFAARPEELKFVVGHVKCGHAELRNNAIGLLAAVQAIDLAIVPDRFQSALPTLGLARLYAWCRESRGLGRPRRAPLLWGAKGRLRGDHEGAARARRRQPLDRSGGEGLRRRGDHPLVPGLAAAAVRPAGRRPEAARAGEPLRPRAARGAPLLGGDRCAQGRSWPASPPQRRGA